MPRIRLQLTFWLIFFLSLDALTTTGPGFCLVSTSALFPSSFPIEMNANVNMIDYGQWAFVGLPCDLTGCFGCWTRLSKVDAGDAGACLGDAGLLIYLKIMREKYLPLISICSLEFILQRSIRKDRCSIDIQLLMNKQQAVIHNPRAGTDMMSS